MSRSRDGRYYEDSDDMVQRIRRAREAFEKKTKAFQGPDWPYYEKRVIVGQKKKEDMDVALAHAAAATPDKTEANFVPSETGSSVAAGATEPGDPSTADDTAAWWAAHRTTQKASDNT